MMLATFVIGFGSTHCKKPTVLRVSHSITCPVSCSYFYVCVFYVSHFEAGVVGFFVVVVVGRCSFFSVCRLCCRWSINEKRQNTWFAKSSMWFETGFVMWLHFVCLYCIIKRQVGSTLAGFLLQCFVSVLHIICMLCIVSIVDLYHHVKWLSPLSISLSKSTEILSLD